MTFSKCWIFLNSSLTSSWLLAYSLVYSTYLQLLHFISWQVSVLIQSQRANFKNCRKVKSSSVILCPQSLQLKAPSPTSSSYLYWLNEITKKDRKEMMIPNRPPAQERTSSNFPKDRSNCFDFEESIIYRFIPQEQGTTQKVVSYLRSIKQPVSV